MDKILPIINSSAIFSPCRLYRYELWRKWDEKLPYCMFIGLNPSTADETKNDPTVRRCIGYAQKWGYGSLCMTNIFAYRATLPKDMMNVEDPVGEGNDEALLRLSKDAGIIIAAWGKHGSWQGRGQKVIEMLARLKCLGKNKDGSPVHPLYQKSDVIPILL